MPAATFPLHEWILKLLQLKSSFGIVFSFQLTVFTSTSSLQYTIFSFQEYVFSSVKLSHCLQYLTKYSLLSSSCFTTLNKSGLYMERWLTPWRTSKYERPFTWEGNYLVFTVEHKISSDVMYKEYHCIGAPYLWIATCVYCTPFL